MSAKHTPGPWEWRDVTHHKGYSTAEELFGADGSNVLDAQEYVIDVSPSDMTLIASAPELLEACKARLPKGHNDTCQHALSEEYQCNCGFDMAVAAIAKAKGGVS